MDREVVTVYFTPNSESEKIAAERLFNLHNLISNGKWDYKWIGNKFELVAPLTPRGQKQLPKDIKKLAKRIEREELNK